MLHMRIAKIRPNGRSVFGLLERKGEGGSLTF